MNVAVGDLGIIYGRTTPGYRSRRSFGTGHRPFDVALANFDDDRSPELAVTLEDDNAVAFYEARGDRHFSKRGVVAVGTGPRAIAVGRGN